MNNELVQIDNEINDHNKMLLHKTTNKMIIKEHDEEIRQIFNDIKEIYEIFTEFNKMVVLQDEKIDNIEMNLETTVNTTKNSVSILEKAKSYYNKVLSKKNKLLLIGATGITINAPITLLLGLKVGFVTGLTTLGIGAFTSYF